MRYALVGEERREAEKGLTGAACPGCRNPMIAKCGTKRAHHWAHDGREHCDPWWENKTEWHRRWQDEFAKEWQEVRHVDDDTGEAHFADVKTAHGWVLEFQHSPIKAEEREAREAFYKRMVWVVNGARLEKQAGKALKAVNWGEKIFFDSNILRIPPKTPVVRNWIASDTHVFFDFQGGRTLLWLLRESNEEAAYVRPFQVQEFLGLHRLWHKSDMVKFDKLVHRISLYVAQKEGLPTPPRPQVLEEGPAHGSPPRRVGRNYTRF